MEGNVGSAEGMLFQLKYHTRSHVTVQQKAYREVVDLLSSLPGESAPRREASGAVWNTVQSVPQGKSARPGLGRKQADSPLKEQPLEEGSVSAVYK